VAGLNCAERVFLTVRAFVETDIRRSGRAVVWSGRRGGGNREGVCGAVSGGVAAIGLVHGRPNPPAGNRERAYEVSRDFVCQFRTASASPCVANSSETCFARERRGRRAPEGPLLSIHSEGRPLCIDTLIRFERSRSPR